MNYAEVCCHIYVGDISQRGQVFRISTEHFETDILPNLTSNDLVIFLGPEINSIHLLERLALRFHCMYQSDYWRTFYSEVCRRVVSS